MKKCTELLLSKKDIQDLKCALSQEHLLGKTLKEQQQQLELFITKGIHVPGHGEGGGAEHTQHKLNYCYTNLAGKFWLLTGNSSYFDYVLSILKAYAEKFPKLGLATSKDTNPPGRLFHQTLNEHMWLLYMVEAYHCIKDNVSLDDQRIIENNLFLLMIDDAIVKNSETIDIIHNHGIWSVAAIAFCGYVLNDQTLVDKALYGLKGDRKSGGFFAQLDELFSIDGYYIEGPYYHRFGLRPLLLLAQAIHLNQPELAIYQYRDQIIKKTCYALFNVAFPDGTFPALNDASRTMDIQDEAVGIALSLCWENYGEDPLLLALASKQTYLWLHSGSARLAERLEKQPIVDNVSHSQLIRDGLQGERGAVAILKQKENEKSTHVALLFYGQHGSIPHLHSALNHGHFDGLHLSLFTRGREYLKDYGFGRWVNIEPKFGGRYIPENNSYCKRTVAHNTLVVDELTQNKGDSFRAEQHWGETSFFYQQDKVNQGMSAIIKDYYEGVDIERSVFMLTPPDGNEPIIIDLFNVISQEEHQYDYCLHPSGQFIHSNIKLDYHNNLSPLGTDNGYQHLWNCACATIEAKEPLVFTWLDNDSFHTVTNVRSTKGQFIIARTGANDPAFNLRSEPMYIIRSRDKNTLLASVIETHGHFNEAKELCTEAKSQIGQMLVEEHNESYSIIRVEFIKHATLILKTFHGHHAKEMNVPFIAQWN